MAITTDSYYDVIYNEETVDRIGLSKTLDNYTIEEIAAMTFCGTEFSLIKNISQREQGVTLLGWDLAKPFDVADGEHIGNGGKYILSPGISPYQYPNGMPFNVVWIAFEYGMAPPIHLNIHEGNASHCKIITEFDAPKYEYQLTAPMQVGGIGAASWNVDDAPLYTTPLYNHDGHDNTLVYRINDNVTTGSLAPNGGAVVPYMFTVVNDYFVLLLLCPYNNQWYSRGNGTGAPWIPDGAVTGGGGYINYNWETSFGASCNVATLAKLSFNGEAISFPYTWYYSENYNGQDWGAPLDCFGYNDLGEPIEVYFNGAPEDGWGSQRAVTLKTFCKNRDQIYKLIAGGGIKFKTDKVYKPIITDGWVTGYTDDMTVPSELDNWHGTTAHSVTPTPPSPTPPASDWDVDPETYGWSGGEVSGMVKYYLLTAGQMSSLQSAIASNANWTIDYLNCIVSCFVVPNSGIFFDAPIPTTVKFKLDNATEWDTGVGCARIQGTKNKSGGTIEIPRLTNTFYDFEPYSDYSVYIPFCGRVPIKGNVCLGHEIKVTYYPDVPTCSLTAVISCGGATIAIAKGSFGTMTPVTSNGSDRKTAAVIGDVAPIITGIGTGIVGVALGNPLIVGAGAAQALGGIMGGVKETVQSYAYSVGSTGDSSFFSAGNRCYYYANYPLIDSVVNNSMFGHSVGYLCNTVGKLSGFKGFTICANPHVTFSASAEEREEIEKLLSMGVIL